MKRLTSVVAVVLATGLIATSAAIALGEELVPGVFPTDVVAELNAAGHPFMAGGGRTIGGRHFAFAAQLTPTGPKGYLVLNDPRDPSNIAGPVTCVTVAGNVATLGIRVKKSEVPGIPVGSGLLWHVTDMGEPVGGQPLDAVGVFLLQSPPTTCPPLPGSTPLSSGNVVVKS